MYKVRHVASGDGNGERGVNKYRKFNYHVLHVVAIPSFGVDVKNRRENKEIKREIEILRYIPTPPIRTST